MPSSAPYGLPIIASIARQMRPASVLDVGVGFGKYGFLFREYLDIWDIQSVSDYDRRRWKTVIEGIEATREYLTPIHDYIYDKIYTGDVDEIIDSLGSYDVIIMGDVLEHLPKQVGVELLDRLYAHTRKCLLLTFPPNCPENYDVIGNPYEYHRSSWNQKDFRRFRNVGYRVFEGRAALVSITKPPHDPPMLTPYFGARRPARGWKGTAARLLITTLGPAPVARLATWVADKRAALPGGTSLPRLPTALVPFTSTDSPTTADELIWERVWQHQPSDPEDDARLAQEAGGPRWALVLDRLRKTFGSIRGLRTIELGSGRGDLSVLLARAGARVTLIDQSEAALEQAQRRFDRLGLLARYERGDILGSLEPWREQADVSLSLGVVEHFRGGDRTKALRAHHTVLKPGGLAVIGVPNSWCLPYRLWKSYLELRGWWPYGVEIPYSKREMTTRARAVGFVEPEMYGLGFWRSVCDHWYKRLLKRRPMWADAPSRLDGLMGLVLVMFGRRAAPLGSGAAGP